MLIGGGAFGKGRQPVPPQPFVFGAFALGFFSVGPYLALRNYLPRAVMEEGEEPSLAEVRCGVERQVLARDAVCVVPALAHPLHTLHISFVCCSLSVSLSGSAKAGV